ncbi:hypothetical protein ACQP2P_13150 [Dactylosporangium sp. CA-139114]|uniref:hypothetical protein n=1 Tax=Dactylosporangium sp. CA-139114 TaxID=3239931 RepID=UPI003D97332C
MPISVWVCDERHQRLASLRDVLHLVPPPLPPGWYEPFVGPADHHRFPMLAHVDPYGNTIFNRTQMSAVLEELATIQPELDGVALSTARALGVLIATHGHRPHRYLWFIGD